MMKHLISCTLSGGLVLVMTTAAAADMIADSNQFGYSGTLQNVTLGTSASVNVPSGSSPRDAVVYFTLNPSTSSGYAGNANDILFNWYQSPQTNQSAGSFQISDGSGTTVTSAAGAWTEEGGGPLWDFNMTVSGGSATFANSSAGLWGAQGTFTNYTYSLQVTGMSTTVLGDGWRYNTSDPTGITGSFDGSFLDTSGNSYLVDLAFDKALWDGTGFSDTYDGNYYGNYSTFAAPVPEPGTFGSLAAGAIGLFSFFWLQRTPGRSLSLVSVQPIRDVGTDSQNNEPAILSLNSHWTKSLRRAA